MNKYALAKAMKTCGQEPEQVQAYLQVRGCRFIERTYRAALAELARQADLEAEADLATPAEAWRNYLASNPA